MSTTVLVTGATGFVGTHVVRCLVKDMDCGVVVLVRCPDVANARQRLERAWWDWPDISPEIGKRVEPLEGNLTDHQLGLSDEQYSHFASKLTHIIHVAANVELNAPLSQLREANVEGTRRVLELARRVHSDHGLARFSFVSTAYVAGLRKGVVGESDLSDSYGFASNYEQSKYEAESLVRSAGSEFPISVFRPGMVVGDSRTGAIKTFNTVYYPLRLYMMGGLRLIPMRPDAKVNMVPVDYVAQTVAKLTLDPRAAGLCFHATLPSGSLPTAREFVRFVREWSRERLGVRLPSPIFWPGAARLVAIAARFGLQKKAAKALQTLGPYLDEDRVYDRANIDRLLGPYKGTWRDFLPPILEYAVYHGFLHRSERTVHEQLLFRLSSRSRPVALFDIVGGRLLRKDAQQFRSEVLQITSSLKSMGVSAGERVGIMGFNSTRYLAIDVALGLMGAISVPLYYTSPMEDISAILSSCGARLLFAGVPGILNKSDDLPGELAVVDIRRESAGVVRKDDVVSFEEFIALGASVKPTTQAPVSPRDIATLRYTSGTTGEPKGAAFSHANLRFMTESLASLPPWKARTSPVTYLSFLPTNHVVEGILGTYSPYYAPAQLNVYFLEDIHDLQRAVPRVRPTIFFSVPRFYEKVWERFCASLLGKLYLGLDHHRLGRVLALGRVLGWCAGRAVLRGAGLDRCSQLIVGSAPVSRALLESYRRLGIEVHNAYGLTEAPLVTLNRIGSNRLETVGEALPNTEVRISNDGEVMVRGPQVMARYEDARGLSEDGWLYTGDLGCLTDEGHLSLRGRKKDVIIDSYGKNILPAKIEMMLKAIPGVTEAMVIGEGRPYCVALLWSDPVAGADMNAVSKGVDEVNSNLSRPERVKRHVVLPHDLSIESGDLTANLKLKREAICRRYAAKIEILYRDGVLRDDGLQDDDLQDDDLQDDGLRDDGLQDDDLRESGGSLRCV